MAFMIGWQGEIDFSSRSKLQFHLLFPEDAIDDLVSYKLTFMKL